MAVTFCPRIKARAQSARVESLGFLNETEKDQHKPPLDKIRVYQGKPDAPEQRAFGLKS